MNDVYNQELTMVTDNNFGTKNFSFSEPAVYQIKVQGTLQERSSDRLGGMQITTSRKQEQNPVSILTGRVNDQAALSGILNSLYEMHLLVLSVEILRHFEN
jgi:hypothetical protein